MAHELRALTSFSLMESGFDSQNPHGNSQPSVAVVPGDMMFSSSLHRHCMSVMHRHTWETPYA